MLQQLSQPTRHTVSGSEQPDFDECLRQAEVCCEQAREAGRMRRFESACGLFSTAVMLYQLVIRMHISSPEAEARLRSIDDERRTYLQLVQDRSPNVGRRDKI